MTAEENKAPEAKIDWNAKSVALLAVAMTAVLLMILFVGGNSDQATLDDWVKRTAEWQSTSGKITGLSKIRHGKSLGPSGSSWEPKVNYSYLVDGAKIDGDTIGKPGFDFANEEEARTYLENFKVGNKVTVYYDPKMIWRSCLVKGERLTKEMKIPQSN